MSIITTTSGRKIRVWLKHTIEGKKKSKMRHVTQAFCKLFDDPEDVAPLTVTAKCNPVDSFNKFEGRSRASKRLVVALAQNMDWLTKEDRHKVIESLCPEFFMDKEQKEQETFRRLKQKFEAQEKAKPELAA